MVVAEAGMLVMIRHIVSSHVAVENMRDHHQTKLIHHRHLQLQLSFLFLLYWIVVSVVMDRLSLVLILL